MKSQSVELTSTGIRRVLEKYTLERAISVYIWNGFIAKAKVVTLDFDTMRLLTVSDNTEILTNG